MMMPISITKVFDDSKLLGSVLSNPSTWQGWRSFLCALFGLPMSEAEADVFRACTGRSVLPNAPFNEAWLVCGRRAGKSFTLAMIAVFLACFREWRSHLAPGERATIMVIATDRKQARVIFGYIRGLLTGVPMLSRLIVREAAEVIELRNGITIEIHVASYRTTRGYTLAAVLCDELAFWRSDDSAEPDYQILDALRPGLGTLPGALLLCASSPYAQNGALYDAYRRYYGQDHSSILVWRAPTRTMNPTFPQATIDAALERDPASAASEYLAEFRTDVQAFISREAVEQCVARGVFERAPIENVRYMAFVDPSGGSSDSMTLAIGHRENKDLFVLDCVRERRSPFSPEAVVAEFVTMIKRYHVGMVRGDRYAGEWPREQFKKLGVEYYSADKPKSDLYLTALPTIMSGKADLLDNQHLVSQLCGLERRTGRGGRDSIDHRPGAHDDLANAVAGLIYVLLRAALTEQTTWAGFGVISAGPRPCFGDHPGLGGAAGLHNPAVARGPEYSGFGGVGAYRRGGG
jgi:hypothetical protein